MLVGNVWVLDNGWRLAFAIASNVEDISPLIRPSAATLNSAASANAAALSIRDMAPSKSATDGVIGSLQRVNCC